jgi:alanyl-tRNA synthetase
MSSKEIRKIFLAFFEKKGHKIVPSSSLIPKDPTVLFTTAGMQQFKEYFLSKESPYGNRVASCQKCFRTSDIEEVGDGKHLTFLEMLGNFSFGFPQKKDSYFKKEAIELALEFLVSDLKLPISNLWFTFFEGDKEIPEDKESKEIWQKLGIKKEKIFGFSKKENFWGPTGKEGPCGPTTEIHYDLTKKACQKGKKCLPNCDCGRFLELWNLVFNQYYQDSEGKLTLLKQSGVDTGMGLERLTMICQKKNSVYETDLFLPIIQQLRVNNQRSVRIIADHLKGAVFLISEGILPSNVERGYVLRRILRRALRFLKLLNLKEDFLIPLAKKVIEIYKNIYPELKSKETDILTVIQNEKEKFEKTLNLGLKEFEKIIQLTIKRKQLTISGKEAFDLFQSYGFPLELTEELAKEKGLRIDKEGFLKAQKEHQKISRAGAEKKFGGVGKEVNYQMRKLHTATHLLHSALRKILGESVRQMGSDINPQRLRFDFSYPKKMTNEEIKKVEDLVNQKIKEDLEVKKVKMPLKEALASGALAFFKEKYPERVTVYSINGFSKEICAGPHVERTSELGHFKILKEESCGAGVRRIRGVVKN